MKILNPGNTYEIHTLWAYLSEDEDGNDGILAVVTDEKAIPLVFSDMKGVKRFRTLAFDVAKQTNVKVKLVEFSYERVVEVVFDPKVAD